MGKPWEYQDQRQMLFALIGYDYGMQPETRLDDIRRDKEQMARYIADTAGIRPEHRVIELGSGCGFISRYIAEKCCELKCCDISQTFIDFARSECSGSKNISFHRIDSGDLSCIPDNWANILYAHNVFIHLNLFDIHLYFEGFNRIIQQGGVVWLDIADAELLDPSLDKYFIQMVEHYQRDRGTLPMLMSWNSRSAVLNIAKYFGFEEITEFELEENIILLRHQEQG